MRNENKNYKHLQINKIKKKTTFCLVQLNKRWKNKLKILTKVIAKYKIQLKIKIKAKEKEEKTTYEKR